MIAFFPVMSTWFRNSTSFDKNLYVYREGDLIDSYETCNKETLLSIPPEISKKTEARIKLSFCHLARERPGRELPELTNRRKKNFF